MRLKWVDLDHFRNLKRQKVELHPRFNLLLGKNGQGKTNFLEAVGYLGTLRSFRSSGRNEMICHGEQLSRIAACSITGQQEHTLAVTLTRKERLQFLDDVRIDSPERYLQTLKVVHFVPEDVGLVDGPPSIRRRIVDRSVFEINSGYVSEYRRYLSVLRHRNALLRAKSCSAQELASWNRSLASNGAILTDRRTAFIRELNPIMGRLGEEMGLGRGLRLTYRPSFQPELNRGEKTGALEESAARDGFEPALFRAGIHEETLKCLERFRDREVKAGHTLFGPHRDRILFVLDEEAAEADLARFGSQGQKRSAVLAFKLALAIQFHRFNGTWPLILLDDVASELDGVRRKALGKIILETGAQLFISTTSDEQRLLSADEGKVFQVSGGLLEPLEEDTGAGRPVSGI